MAYGAKRTSTAKDLTENVYSDTFRSMRSAKLGKAITIVLLALYILMILFSLITDRNPNYVTSLLPRHILYAATFFISLLFIRRGYPRVGSFITVIAGWTIITLRVFLFGGITTPLFVGYFLCILMAGIMLTRNVAIVISIFTLISLFATDLIGSEPVSALPPQYSNIISLAVISIALILIFQYDTNINTYLAFLSDELKQRKESETVLEQQTQRLEILNSIATKLSLQDNSAELLAQITPEIRQLLPCAICNIVLADIGQQEAVHLASELVELALPQHLSIKNTIPETWQALIDGQDAVINTDLAHSTDPLLIQFASLNLSSAISLPLFSHGQIIGAFTAFCSHDTRHDENHIEIAQSIANLVAPALTNSILLAEIKQQTLKQEAIILQRTASLAQANQLLTMENQAHLETSDSLRLSFDRTSALYKLSQAIDDFTDLDALLQIITDQVTANLPADRVLIIVCDEDMKEIVHFTKGGPGKNRVIGFSIERLSSSISGYAIKTGKIINSPNWDDDRLTLKAQNQRRQRGIGALLAAPLSLPNNMKGVITAINLPHHPLFDEQAEQILQAMSAQIGVAIENNYLYEALNVQLELLQTQRNRQSALAAIVLAINTPAELQSVLQTLVKITSDELPASGGVSIILWDPESNEFSQSASSILTQPIGLTQTRVRREGGASRWIIDTKQELIVTDIETDPFGANPLMAEYGISSYVGMPLLDGNVVHGVLYALDTYCRTYNEADLTFLRSVAGRAALALTKVQQNVQARKLARLEERQRLARELHDLVSQSLFSANLIAQTLPRVAINLPEDIQQGLSQLGVLTGRALGEMRTLLLEIRPESQNSEPLNLQIAKLAETQFRSQNIELTLNLQQNVYLNSEAKITIYRIAQEAMNNIVKYANATHVHVILSSENGCMRLLINDNGNGFNLTDPNNGHGLNIMKERAKSVGATLSIDSQPEKGVSVSLVHQIGKVD